MSEKYVVVLREVRSDKGRLGFEKVLLHNLSPHEAAALARRISKMRHEYEHDPRSRRSGGIARARGYRRSDFNPKSLAVGRKVEMEHTTSRRVAERIAMDHLSEDPRYYEKLLKYVEKSSRDVPPRMRAKLSRKIRILIHEGYPQKQAVAIAYRMLGIARRK